MKSITLSLLLGSLLCAGGAHATAAEHVRVSHAWIRVLPGDLPAGAYVTLQNDGDQPAALSGASSTRYTDVMLHHSSTAGGMSRMTMVDTVTVPAHGQAVLAPAGYHFMLMRATKPVKPGDSIPLTLKFSDGSTLVARFIARPANAIDAGGEHAGH
ncbi:copper chaperone PCu(A)C [Rhodanobacter umsongensis]|uniref:Copper chaperone PCu(A)C n=1 Tax=Rhodanobacter umsongensis TaxID=633153 RepID=A0ABW0JIJ8_9GAMM